MAPSATAPQAANQAARPIAARTTASVEMAANVDPMSQLPRDAPAAPTVPAVTIARLNVDVSF